MKLHCAHALVYVVASWTGGGAVAFFLAGPSFLRAGSLVRQPGASQIVGASCTTCTNERSPPRELGRTSGRGRYDARRSIRLSATSEDCKSCKEQELLEAEAKAARGAGGIEEELRVKRAAFEEANRVDKMRNVKIALGAFLSTVCLFFFQHSVIAPVQANPVKILRTMESESAPLVTALANGRPTVVDFYAEWCENCKTMAPRMKEIEEQFKNQINFIVVDGSSEKNYDLVDAFRVDGIPHLAMVNSEGNVETAIIGLVPKEVVVEDIQALVAGKDLPYKGFDMFEGEEHNIKIQLEKVG